MGSPLRSVVMCDINVQLSSLANYEKNLHSTLDDRKGVEQEVESFLRRHSSLIWVRAKFDVYDLVEILDQNYDLVLSYKHTPQKGVKGLKQVLSLLER